MRKDPSVNPSRLGKLTRSVLLFVRKHKIASFVIIYFYVTIGFNIYEHYIPADDKETAAEASASNLAADLALKTLPYQISKVIKANSIEGSNTQRVAEEITQPSAVTKSPTESVASSNIQISVTKTSEIRGAAGNLVKPVEVKPVTESKV